MAKKKSRIGQILLLMILAAVIGTGAYLLYKDTTAPPGSFDTGERIRHLWDPYQRKYQWYAIRT